MGTMNVHFEMIETPEGFTIHVERPRSWVETILNAAACGVVTYIFIRYVPQMSAIIANSISIVVAALAGYSRGQPRSITTTITKFEAHIVGTVSGGYRPPPYVPLADISYLEYREAVSGGGETADQPEGLWAVLENSSACLVPYIEKSQTEALVTAIHKRFEHILGSAPSRSTGFSATGLIQLNLNKP